MIEIIRKVKKNEGEKKKVMIGIIEFWKKIVDIGEGIRNLKVGIVEKRMKMKSKVIKRIGKRMRKREKDIEKRDVGRRREIGMEWVEKIEDKEGRGEGIIIRRIKRGKEVKKVWESGRWGRGDVRMDIEIENRLIRRKDDKKIKGEIGER